MAQAPWQIEAEKKKQEALAAIVHAPKPDPPPTSVADDAGPSKMDTEAPGNTADLPE